MTKQEFYARLRYHALDWEICCGEVRARDRKGHTFCPVTAVCFMETGEYYGVEEYTNAAIRLGLDSTAAAEIVLDADCPEPDNKVIETLDLADTLRDYAAEQAYERAYRAR